MQAMQYTNGSRNNKFSSPQIQLSWDRESCIFNGRYARRIFGHGFDGTHGTNLGLRKRTLPFVVTRRGDVPSPQGAGKASAWAICLYSEARAEPPSSPAPASDSCSFVANILRCVVPQKGCFASDRRSSAAEGGVSRPRELGGSHVGLGTASVISIRSLRSLLNHRCPDG